MSMELSTPFLPLGSVLKLKETENDSLYYFIVARAISKNDKGEIFSRYKVALRQKELIKVGLVKSNQMPKNKLE
ncbi:hypothetical protein DW630_RS09960 [Enterococcus hirae]